MKTLTRMLFAAVAALTIDAQPKPGDFEVKPLPEMGSIVPRMRSVMRGTQVEGVRPCDENICSTTLPSACLEIAFPETAWRTCISNQGRRGVMLGPTDLKRSRTDPWMRILREAGPAEIFVPYHGVLNGLNLRLYDHESTSAQSILQVKEEDAGGSGQVVKLSGQSMAQVVAETNDTGIAWLCKTPGRTGISRRGLELVLWAVQDAANYDFIIEYRLRDDGSIGFRLGATGFNNPYYPPRSTTEPHMHDVMWRVDADLNGSANDNAILHTHKEGHLSPASAVAQDFQEPFNAGKEGTLVWNPEQYMSIGVEDETTRNVHGNRIGYTIQVNANGIARHYGERLGIPRRERFTLSDFAVTTFKQSERDALIDSARIRYLHADQYLLGELSFAGMGVSDNESVMNTDIVLWHRTSAHHSPHDEDHAPGDPAALMTGITDVHWQGFDFMPHNLFDFNPRGGPSRTQCQ